jgi:hypothetical protein
MRVLRVKARVKTLTDSRVHIIENDMLLGDEERLKDVLERLYNPKVFTIVSFDFYELNVFKGQQVYDLGRIDFDLLSKQKKIFINMLQDWGEADDPDQRNDADIAEGLLRFIDTIQDYAVDELLIPEKVVFPYLEQDAEEIGEALNNIGMADEEFREWVKANQPIDESDVFYDNAPPKIKAVLDTYKDEGDLYKECDRIIKELNKLGYDADYGLDGQALYDFKLLK